MAQKILAGRTADPSLAGDFVLAKVDHVVLARSASAVVSDAVRAGLKVTGVETAVAYDGCCVTDETTRASFDASAMLARGILAARPGAGFAGVVHLERFASPARLCVTDEPRLAGVGGAGMLSFVVPPGQLAQALAQGTVWLRPPRSIQVLVTGRMRPFVCARDVALELLRRGVADAVRRVEAQHRGPVVLEVAGPSVRLLSVAERSVLAAIAPQVGAAAVLFASDERTEVFLRDQRRSKAHRALVPDAGAPCDEVVNVDLAAIDPLVLDETGKVRSVRDVAGTPVSQVVLGGDSGATLRDLFAAAALLKSKRVPPRVDLLLAVPSRQMLETLAQAGALTDLIATGARLIEPDARAMEGLLYPPPRAASADAGLSARTCDPEPGAATRAPFAVASAETLAYAVATGEMGDPRSFKRPVRVTVPRALPTDDVLVVRERRGRDVAKRAAGPSGEAPVPLTTASPWRSAQTLELIEPAGMQAAMPHANGTVNGKVRAPAAVVCGTLDDVRLVVARSDDAPHVRAVLAPFIPTSMVGLLSARGIAAIEVDEGSLPSPRDAMVVRSVSLPAPAQWGERQATSVAVDGAKVPMTWLAVGVERTWANAGTASPQGPAKDVGRADKARRAASD